MTPTAAYCAVLLAAMFIAFVLAGRRRRERARRDARDRSEP
jgi:hypothetical protein